MKLNKHYQKIMPSGVDLILQGEAVAGVASMKIVIKRGFGSQQLAAAWCVLHLDRIRNDIEKIEKVLAAGAIGELSNS